jgi:titin
VELNGFSGSGLLLNGASYVNISLDYIGIEWRSTPPIVTYTARGNGGDGVVLAGQAQHDTLKNCLVANSGGNGVTLSTGANQDSVKNSTITANAANGITITDAGTRSNVISGDQIGDGPAAYQTRNGGNGVLVQAGATSNTVGGAAAGAGNVISGNAVCGVYLKDPGTCGNVVEGDLIGTDASGTLADPNRINGVDIVGGASFNTVGGTTPGARNVLSGNAYNGVVIAFAGTVDNLVEGNDIGTTASGGTALANGGDGVDIVGGANTNTIGGASAAARNIISGNSGNGVNIRDANSNNNVIAHNDIGTNLAGTAALANGGDGVLVQNGATNNTVGGTAAGSGNVVSGNAVCGVYLKDPGTSGNVVEGDLIGTNAAGTAAVPNGDGVEIELGAAQNTIGGTSPNARNLISGNTNNGVLLSGNGAFTEDNVVEENFIGTNAAGRSSLPNGATGVLISGGAVDNTIGGASSAAGNVISGNAGDGVMVSDAGTSNNTIQYNEIGTDATGESPVSNAYGVVIRNGASSTSILNNVISANIHVGLLFTDPTTTNNLAVTSNLIGVDVTGTRIVTQAGQAYSNGVGVQFMNGAHSNLLEYDVISGNNVGALFSTGATADQLASCDIGTDAVGTLNLGNVSDGVEFLHVAGNFLSYDSIYFNGGYGVYSSDVYSEGNNFGTSVFTVVINGISYGNKKGMDNFLNL